MTTHSLYVLIAVITTLLTLILPFLSDEFFTRLILVPHFDYACSHDFNIEAKVVYNSMAAQIVYWTFQLLWKLGIKIGLPYAFTIWRRIYIRTGYIGTKPQVLMHEYEHIRQWYDLGVWAPLEWIAQVWKYGYRRAPMELQARSQAGQRLT